MNTLTVERIILWAAILLTLGLTILIAPGRFDRRADDAWMAQCLAGHDYGTCGTVWRFGWHSNG